MTDFVTIKGNLGAAPKYSAKNGVPITRFNVGSTERRFNRSTREWEDGHTNWHRIVVFRDQAKNAAVSLAKGSAVVIHGRIRNRRINQGTEAEPKWLYLSEIEADHVGVDLNWGFVNYFHGVAAEPPQSESGLRSESAVIPAGQDSREPAEEEDDGDAAGPIPPQRETDASPGWGSSFGSLTDTDGGNGAVDDSDPGTDETGEQSNGVQQAA
ncbi:single-stranded DNA-binding protein [Zhihengliuella halotolerans]|uniref:Single-strand DNA-binding protein n=1 Tax=Zhihengliuella halotolerans TaxID=370736 RepID=A0A4Q8ACD1_9MICC|nr:single-stranded DNA-binding protein [Zhihengliuella halotolerans]RZU61285.1 single-strand DNA-binding protein [Zhihengliuella halotolerans]